MLKILNTKTLSSKLNRLVRTVAPDCDFVFEKDKDTYLFGLNGNILSTKDEKEIVRLLFGPLKESPMKMFDPKSCEILEKILPLKVWLWGWDSV
jgi:hypothetical protein